MMNGRATAPFLLVKKTRRGLAPVSAGASNSAYTMPVNNAA
jgi:hypothetical protein